MKWTATTSLVVSMSVLAFLPCAVLDRCDVVEVNHIYDQQTGFIAGSFYIWWELKDGGYSVRDWRAAKDVHRPVNGVQEFWDSKSKVRRRIESKVFTETFTWYDRESEDRKRLPESKRRKLTVPR